MESMIRAFLLLCFAACGFSPSAEAGKRVALVIGNSAYEHAPPLNNAKADAEAVAAALKRLDFEVVKGTDLTRFDFEASVREFSKAVRGAEVALFFYAGHGLQVDGQNYLAPVDAELADESDLEFETLPVRTIIKQMERHAATNLVFLDACRNNPLARNLARSMGTRSAAIGRGLARISTGIGTLIAFATEPGNVALDGDGPNSPFTTSLLKHIATPGLDVAQLMRRVRRDVIEMTSGRQVPWDNSSLTGDFFFAGHGAATPVETPRVQRPAVDPAAEAWGAVQNSDSKAVLEAFLNRFPDGFYGDLAKARLKELEEKRAAVLRQSPEAAPTPEHAGRPRSPRENCSRLHDSLYCVSSALGSSRGNSYQAMNLTDGRDQTAWVEGISGHGIGEWVVIEFDRQRDIRRLDIRNGYGKSGDIYAKNGRVKEVEIVFSNGESLRRTLQDTSHTQSLALDGKAGARWVQIKILSVYPGWKYQDTAISELRVQAD